MNLWRRLKLVISISHLWQWNTATSIISGGLKVHYNQKQEHFLSSPCWSVVKSFMDSMIDGWNFLEPQIANLSLKQPRYHSCATMKYCHLHSFKVHIRYCIGKGGCDSLIFSMDLSLVEVLSDWSCCLHWPPNDKYVKFRYLLQFFFFVSVPLVYLFIIWQSSYHR